MELITIGTGTVGIRMVPRVEAAVAASPLCSYQWATICLIAVLIGSGTSDPSLL